MAVARAVEMVKVAVMDKAEAVTEIPNREKVKISATVPIAKTWTLLTVQIISQIRCHSLKVPKSLHRLEHPMRASPVTQVQDLNLL